MTGETVPPEPTHDPLTGHAPSRDHAAPPETTRRFAEEFDKHLESFLTPVDAVPDRLQAAMRYAALGPGKRLRPFLVVRCCELVGGARANAWHVAAAIECVHAFSLVHDDLPSMDDDDLRRGRPTCHKAFDEATAILAGDALLSRAFELLTEQTCGAAQAVRLVTELAGAVGWYGLIGGQAADVAGETQTPSFDLAKFIHDRKTGALFRASCRLGVIAGGGTSDQVEVLGSFGHDLGVSFQIADDLLDVSASTETLGKRAGKDVAAGKQSFPRCVGIAGSRAAANTAVERALAQLHSFGPEADDLRQLARFMVDRDY